MKVAILCESVADQDALRILADAVLGIRTELLEGSIGLTQSWPSLLNALPAVYRYLYYNSDADGLIVVADGNGSLVHRDEHELPASSNPRCRLCQLRGVLEIVQSDVPNIGRERPLLTALGMPYRQIEAWYRCRYDAGVNEAAWLNGQSTGSYPYADAQLKKLVYGTDRPGLDLARTRAREDAEWLAEHLPLLEASFPVGFGGMARELRGWLASSA